MGAMNKMGNDLVAEARKRAGLTQLELAQRAGTTQSAIARLEVGRTRPTFETVLRLIRLCGLDLRVGIVERDESAWEQAQELLQLTPAERLERAVRFANKIRSLQDEVAASGAA
jgi:transcriptional regulator with XRE-family HTH domain